MTYDPTAPAQPRKRKRGGLIAALVSVGVLLVAALVVVGVLVFSPPAAANEIVLDAAAEVGADPFSADPFASEPPVVSTTTTAPTTTAAPTTAAPSVSAATPGLYGGTQEVGRCDAEQLTAFLEANPDKAAAWVAALNADPGLRWTGGALKVSDIRAYVGTLTSLILMADTRVTNHGFAGGTANQIQSVLEAGTAVLVDPFGVPRARCYCGNPLIPAKVTSPTATFTGTPWPGFEPNKVVTLTGTPEAIRDLLTANPLDLNAPLTSTPLTGGTAPTPSTPAPSPTATPAPSDSPSAVPQPTPVPPAAGLYTAAPYVGDPSVTNTVANNTGNWVDIYTFDASGQPQLVLSVAPGVQDATIYTDLTGDTWVATSGSPDVISTHVITPGSTWTIN